MRKRHAIKILKGIERGRSFPQHEFNDALGVLSKRPQLVDRIACQPHKLRFWGVEYEVKPRLVYQRFGDGRLWGTLSPLNTRPNYYLIMGDSSWVSGGRSSNDDKFRDALESEIYQAIEDQYGCGDLYCEDCSSSWSDDCEACGPYRQWPALDLDCGSTWAFPCYRNDYQFQKYFERKYGRPIRLA